MRQYVGIASHALPEPNAPDFSLRLRHMLSTIDLWARDASFGFGRIESGEVPSGSGGTLGATDHGLLSGLGDDDHTQYLNLGGRTGGQVLVSPETGSVPLTLRMATGQSADALRIETAASGNIFRVTNNSGALIIGNTETLTIGVRNITQDLSLSSDPLTVECQSYLDVHSTDSARPAKFFVNNGNGGPSTPVSFGAYVRHNDTGSTAAALLVSNVGAGTGPLQVWTHTESTEVARLTSTGVFSGAGVQLAYTAKTGAYGATTSDSIINCTSGTFTVTLPTAVSVPGRLYIVKNSGAGVITVDTTSSQTIDGAATQVIAAAGVLRVASDGANWIIV